MPVWAVTVPRPRSAQFSTLIDFYRGLSPRARLALWVLLAIEAILIVAAERDIQRRPAADIRGPKLLWRAIATQNILGPAAYFWLGRRPAPQTVVEGGRNIQPGAHRF